MNLLKKKKSYVKMVTRVPKYILYGILWGQITSTGDIGLMWTLVLVNRANRTRNRQHVLLRTTRFSCSRGITAMKNWPGPGKARAFHCENWAWHLSFFFTKIRVGLAASTSATARRSNSRSGHKQSTIGPALYGILYLKNVDVPPF